VIAFYSKCACSITAYVYYTCTEILAAKSECYNTASVRVVRKEQGVKIRDPPLPSLPLPLLCPFLPPNGSDVPSARGVDAYSRGSTPGNSHTEYSAFAVRPSQKNTMIIESSKTDVPVNKNLSSMARGGLVVSALDSHPGDPGSNLGVAHEN
jgi:hypothetical protein